MLSEATDHENFSSLQSSDLAHLSSSSDEIGLGCIDKSSTPKLGGFTMNFYKKDTSLPRLSPTSNRTVIKVSHHRVSKKKDDRINKGVFHKIKKPRIVKAKDTKKNRAKGIVSRMREVKMPPRFAANRSPLKPGKKSKRHQLSSPGCSLLDSPDTPSSSLENEKRIFTSRSKEAAIVQISKTIKLSAENGTIKISPREGGFQKKNIGRTVELELENQIAAASLNSPVSSITKLESVGLMSSALCRSPRPTPTRFRCSPSPKKTESKSLACKEVNSPKRTPVRSSPRRNMLKAKYSPVVLSSPSNLRRSPRKIIVDFVNEQSKMKDENSNSEKSPKRQQSPKKSNGSSALLSERFCISEENELEDLDLALENISSSSQEEDEILSSLLKENESPLKIVNSPRRSPRKSRPVIQHCKVDDVPTGNLSQEHKDPQKSSAIDDEIAEPMSNVKYFSVFDRDRKNRYSPGADKTNVKQNSSTSKRCNMNTSDDTQLILDAGQKKFGPFYCKTCGFLYEIGSAEDEAAHAEFHDGITVAVKYNGWKQEHQVRNVDHLGGRVIRVSPSDPHYCWRKVAEVLRYVDQELGFSESGIRNRVKTYVYLYILDKQIVGCLVAEQIDKAYRVIQDSAQLNSDKTGKVICCSDVPQLVFLGISRIWVYTHHRRKGIATILVDTMRANYCFGQYLHMDQFAFSDPTQFGMCFAEKYSKRPDFLVYRREVDFTQKAHSHMNGKH